MKYPQLIILPVRDIELDLSTLRGVSMHWVFHAHFVYVYNPETLEGKLIKNRDVSYYNPYMRYDVFWDYLNYCMKRREVWNEQHSRK
jgi:hypothetical protein